MVHVSFTLDFEGIRDQINLIGLNIHMVSYMVEANNVPW